MSISEEAIHSVRRMARNPSVYVDVYQTCILFIVESGCLHTGHPGLEDCFFPAELCFQVLIFRPVVLGNF